MGSKTLKTEIVQDKVFDGWREYADLLLLAAIAQARLSRETPNSISRQRRRCGTARGFNDRVVESARQYATYKLAALFDRGKPAQAKPQVEVAVRDRLLAQQAEDGGWITDYNSKGERVGLANVETTSLALLALSAAKDKQTEF